MSRSYKHSPYAGQRKDGENKRLANKTVRQAVRRGDRRLLRLLEIDSDFPEYDGRGYKKLFQTYNICDYCRICTWREFVREIRANEVNLFFSIPREEETEEEKRKKWEKDYRRK